MDASKQQELEQRAPKRHRRSTAEARADEGDYGIDQYRPNQHHDDLDGPAPAPAPAPLSSYPPQRIIIALDLDAFYVAASRVRDPSLNGLPIGIKQKGILATASYEARARGVQKLATVKDAMARCPDLILVNGEDLSFFRKLSNQIWRLVRSIVWGQKVEKLGLDELFCDVTEMVAFNLALLEQGQHSGRQASPAHRRAFFRLDRHDAHVGFEYDVDATVGHHLPLSEPTAITHDPARRAFGLASHLAAHLRGLILHHDVDATVGHHLPLSEPTAITHDPARRAFGLASHLAAHLRGLILHHVGLTASAGIAHNKLLAKLACAMHKPAAQTAFAPTSQDDTEAFLDAYEVRSLNGFGGSIVNKLRTALGGEALGHSGTEWLNGGLGADPQAKLQEERAGAPPVALTVSLCRKAFSATSFADMFGERLGKRLWGLLSGRDDEDVVPAPPFPSQISIEDTYKGLRGPAIQEQLHALSMSLLRRLEAELVDVDEGDNLSSLSSTVATSMYAAINEPLRLPSDQAADSEPHAGLRDATVRSYVERPASGAQEAVRGTAPSDALLPPPPPQPPSPRSTPANSPPRTWKRYPLSVRLSIRQGWNNRISKQTRMPVEIFDLSLSMADRAAALVSTLSGLHRAMVHGHSSQQPASPERRTTGGLGPSPGLNLINIAALDLSHRRPDAALGRFFAREGMALPRSSSSSRKRPSESLDLDLDVLRDLPPDLRREVAAQYGIDQSQLTGMPSGGGGGAGSSSHAASDAQRPAPHQDAAAASLPPGSPDSTPPPSPPTLTSIICEKCGAFQEAWLQHDHTIWPIRGLPPALAEGQGPSSARWERERERQGEGDETLAPSSGSDAPVVDECGQGRAETATDEEMLVSPSRGDVSSAPLQCMP